MQHYEILNQNQVEFIHESSLRILEEIGIDFHYGPALTVWKKGGAKIEGERVFISPRLVEEQVQKAPRRFTLYARNPQKNVVVGGDHMVFTPGYGAPFVYDADRGRRKGTLKDLENFVKLTHASKYQDICNGMVVEPNDVPHDVRHLHKLYTAIKLSDKCFMGSVMGVEAARDSIRLASILFGDETQLAEKPCMISLLPSLTPLKYDERMLGAIMVYAQYGQPQLISSLAIAGATAPVTMGGLLALQNAEILAGIVLTQLVREGAPVVYSGSSSIANMRSGALSIGSPEMAMNTAVTAQMARYYHLPARGGGAVSDAKIADAQAGYESMMNTLMAQVSGINFVLHAAGILDAYNCVSFEKFVIDDEICGMVKRIQSGYEITEETLGFDAIKETGPGGHFFDKKHTIDHFRAAHYEPGLSNRDGLEEWRAKGLPQITESACRKYKAVLESCEIPELSADVEKDLLKYVHREN
jgi:trimethylamine--corrinoid protein Co-methyltransferase